VRERERERERECSDDDIVTVAGVPASAIVTDVFCLASAGVVRAAFTNTDTIAPGEMKPTCVCVL
jgi:hypothetical protein